MNPVFFPWFIAAGLITADDTVHNHHLPIPSRFLASFVIFGMLGVLADTSFRPAATLIAWGLDIVMFMNFAGQKAPVLGVVGDLLLASGQPTTAATLPASTSSGPTAQRAVATVNPYAGTAGATLT